MLSLIKYLTHFIFSKNSNKKFAHVYMLCMHKVVSRKIDVSQEINLLFGLCKKLVLKRYMYMCCSFYTDHVFFLQNFTNVYGLWRCLCEFFFKFFSTKGEYKI
jgi:hypothetical protein